MNELPANGSVNGGPSLTSDLCSLTSGARRRPARRAGFTLVELLAVMLIGAVLIAVLSTAYLQARQHAKRARAETQLRELVKAWTEYWQAYEQWPASLNGQTDAPMTYDNLKYLFATENPRAIPFLSLKLLPGETYADPWGNPYKISFKANPIQYEFALRIAVGFPNRDRYRQ